MLQHLKLIIAFYWQKGLLHDSFPFISCKGVSDTRQQFCLQFEKFESKLNFSLRTISNEKNASVVSIHPQHVSGKD